MANQTSPSNSTEALAALQPGKTQEDGSNNQPGKQNGINVDQSSAGSDGAANQMGALPRNAAPGSSEGAASPDSVDNPSVTHISLPKDGHFGVVVVGSSLAEQYPEAAAIWGDRLVYTVYLRVGEGKSWLLQYSVPNTGTATATTNSARPEAPWPFEIFSPHLAASDYNSDAILVHGFVNPEGRFEQLAVVFPPEFTQPKFLLRALQQWQFRAARQYGQSVATEILLIIPGND